MMVGWSLRVTGQKASDFFNPVLESVTRSMIPRIMALK